MSASLFVRTYFERCCESLALACTAAFVFCARMVLCCVVLCVFRRHTWQGRARHESQEGTWHDCCCSTGPHDTDDYKRGLAFSVSCLVLPTTRCDCGFDAMACCVRACCVVYAPHGVPCRAVRRLLQENLYTKEEMKVTWETRKILDVPDMAVRYVGYDNTRYTSTGIPLCNTPPCRWCTRFRSPNAPARSLPASAPGTATLEEDKVDKRCTSYLGR